MIRFGLSLLSVCWIAGVVVAGPALEVVQAQLPAPELEARGLLSLQGDVQRSLEHHIAARAAWLREDAAGALALWKQAAEADPANAAAWLGVARAATALEQTELAFAGWRFRHELVPNDLQAKGAIGESLAGTGNFELAAAFLLAGRAADVEDRVRWRREMRLFSLLHAMDQKAAAQEVGEALYQDITRAAEADPPSDEADARWRRVLHELHETGVSGAALSAAMVRGFKAQALAAERDGVERARAMACAARFHSAALAVAAATGVEPANVSRYLDQIGTGTGVALLPTFRTPMPKHAALHRSAVQSMSVGRPAVAEALLREAHTLAPDSAMVNNALGWLLLERRGVSNEVVRHLEAAHAAAPDDPSILDSLGWLRVRQGRADEAVGLLERAREGLLAFAPRVEGLDGPAEDPEVLYHLGEALLKTGRIAEAKAVFTRALRMLSGPIAQWQVMRLGAEQRRDWGLQVIRPEDLYTLRFGQIEQVLRARLAGL